MAASGDYNCLGETGTPQFRESADTGGNYCTHSRNQERQISEEATRIIQF